MIEAASTILDTLCSLTSNTIFILQNQLTIAFSQWFNKTILLFTTASFVTSLHNSPKHFTIFTLENNKNNVDKKHWFATIDDLIYQLADEIVRKYGLEAYQHDKADELSKAKQQEEKANQIYRELTRR